MPITTLVVVFIFWATLMLLVWAVFASFPRIPRVSPLSFWCPFLGRDVTAEFQEGTWNGKRVEVQSCTAFQPPTAVTCDKLCLDLARFPAPPPTRHHAA